MWLLFSPILCLLPSMSSIGVALVTKVVASYSQRRLRQCCISLLYSSKKFYPPFITNKTKCISFKCECGIRVAKHLKGHWFIVLHWLSFVLLIKAFIANALKCKARLKTKFKCVCVTVCSLVMSLFSHDFTKTGK